MGAITLAVAISAPSKATAAESAATQTLLAKSTKKNPSKRKKRRSPSQDNFGPADIEAISDNDQGVGIHRDQEGVDRPYIAEIAGLTELTMLTEKEDSNDSRKETELGIGGRCLFILGSVAVGPDIGIIYTKGTETSDSGAEPITSDTSSLFYNLGGAVKYHFANLDRDLLVPYVLFGLGLINGESKYDDTTTKFSGYLMKLGGGFNMFVDSNVAFTPQLEYWMRNLTNEGQDGQEDTKLESTYLKALFGIAVFI